jgi:hypothetical protein
MADFDLSAARKAGYSDAEIADFLGQAKGIDTGAARSAGYTDGQMLAQLMRPTERSAGERIGRAAVMPAVGFNEGLARVAGGIPDASAWLMRQVGVPSEPDRYTDMARRGLRAVTGEPPVPETTTERALHGAGEAAPQVAATLLPGMALARALPAGSVMQGAAQTMSQQPVMQMGAGMVGGAVGEAADSPLLGNAAAMATPVGVAAAGRFISPVRSALTSEAERLAQVAMQEGIPLSAGQRTGSRFLQGVESQFGQLPLTARPQAAVNDQARVAFNRAVLQRAGIDADRATPDVLLEAQNRIGGTIGAIADRTTARMTPGNQRTLAQLEAEVTRNAAPEVQARALNRIQDVRSLVDQAGNLRGPAVRQLDSAIGAQIRSTDGDMRAYLIEVQNSLRNAMLAGASRADARDLAVARRQYANLVRVENAMGGAGKDAAAGNIPPAQLRAAVANGDRRGYALGRGDLNDLSRVGTQFVQPSIPDSGTAQRTMVNSLLTGGGLGGSAALMGADPVTAVGAGLASLAVPRAVQSIYNTPAAQAYLTNALAQRRIPQMSGGTMAGIGAAQGFNRLAQP